MCLRTSAPGTNRLGRCRRWRVSRHLRPSPHSPFRWVRHRCRLYRAWRQTHHCARDLARSVLPLMALPSSCLLFLAGIFKCFPWIFGELCRTSERTYNKNEGGLYTVTISSFKSSKGSSYSSLWPSFIIGPTLKSLKSLLIHLGSHNSQ